MAAVRHQVPRGRDDPRRGVYAALAAFVRSVPLA
jgi:hypothetical protein